MSAIELLASLNAAGFDLQAADGKIRIRPVEAVTPELQESIRSARDELLALLAPRVEHAPPTTTARVRVRVGQRWAVRSPDPFRLRPGGDVLELTAIKGDSVGYVFITEPQTRGFCRIVDLR